MPMHDSNDDHHHFTLAGEGEVEVVVACQAWQAVLAGEDWQGYVTRAIEACFIAGDKHKHKHGYGHRQSLTILLADNARMHDLNRRFGKQDKATNVLAFPAIASHGYLGDIALGYEAVAAGAYDRGVPIFAHAVHLIVHGVLHLLGYDHKGDEEASRMEALESEIMLALDLPDPHFDVYTNTITMRQVANHGR